MASIKLAVRVNLSLYCPFPEAREMRLFGVMIKAPAVVDPGARYLVLRIVPSARRRFWTLLCMSIY